MHCIAALCLHCVVSAYSTSTFYHKPVMCAKVYSFITLCMHNIECVHSSGKSNFQVEALT